ncbi:MAG TPA: FKBP-type peptidyl-prolyl cis-trans isomerase [Burkholderiaceae bacterium]|jgi:FKBP-type peptidyl-prolyl cis-trans isomerase
MSKHASFWLAIALGICLCNPAAAADKKKAGAAKPPATPASAAASVAAPAQLGITTASGLTYMVTHAANGRHAQAGEVMFSHYTVLLADGKKIESSIDHGDPFGFTVGAGQVIKGMEEVMSKLGVGDEAVAIMPPQIAYGEKGAGTAIPPGSTLVFLLHVMDIRAHDKVLSNVLQDLVQNQGLEAAVKRYRELKAAQFGDIYASEGELASLAYRLLKKKMFTEAIAFLKLNTEAYPKSADAFANLADGFKKSGDKAQALLACQHALELDPKNADALELLAELQKPAAP